MGKRWLPGLLLGLCAVAPLAAGGGTVEKGVLSIFFREEKVGYEEYTWTEDSQGYSLSVTGRMTSPMVLEIERLDIRVSPDYIPSSFTFRGSVNGVSQEVESTILEGSVRNRIRVAGRPMDSSASIRRNALLLPNPIFAPYLIAARKFRCAPQAPAEFSAYVIPQMEVIGLLEVKADSPCTLVLTVSGVQIYLATDEAGGLKSLVIPSQNIRVVVSPVS